MYPKTSHDLDACTQHRPHVSHLSSRASRCP